MLKRVSRLLVGLVERYLPDSYIFVIILTVVAMLAATLFEGCGPLQVIRMWGGGLWSLLQFSMQMLLVLVTGYMMAATPPVRRGLSAIANLQNSPAMAIVSVTLVALVASWLNWGFGLVAGGLFAKEIARRIRVDYRLLIASAYSGFLVWHGGLSGSIPLSIATEGHPFQSIIGIVAVQHTLFSGFNIAIVIALFITLPVVNMMMLPKDDDSVYIDPASLGSSSESVGTTGDTPSERLLDSRGLTILIGLAGLVWLIDYFIHKGALTLNVINFAFLFAAIILHGTPRRLLASLNEAVKGGGAIIIQFPFYAGIMAIMTGSGLAMSISHGLVSLSSQTSFPFWTFLSAGLVNLFVPSGGGQWAVQAPVILPAAQAMGVDVARASMAVAWGDAWTNLIQPFWALPLLAIAGLKARDIMGFCMPHLFLSGVIIAVGLVLI
ncbi:MAG: TIGR00366 family protein [Hyphomicrobiales bacterium]